MADTPTNTPTVVTTKRTDKRTETHGVCLNDLIKRTDAIDALNEYFARIGKLKRRGLTKGEKAISLDTVGAIKTLPSAQRKGKWTVTPVYIKCSECGESFMLIPQNYCPNCGALMKGEEDERIKNS